MRILLVEDEVRLAKVIRKGLMEEGYAVDIAHSGEDGQFMAESEPYDIIILDIMLPQRDGVSILKDLRKQKISTPILMLTAKSNLEDKVAGLDSGADDYLTKPFEFAELKSRLRALIRRNTKESSPILSVNDLVLDPAKHEVTRNSKLISLTPKEFAVLEFLMRHKDEVVTRTMITEHIWDYNFEGMSNIVDVFLANIRKKIDKGSNKQLIHTLHGVGYKISENEE